MQRRRIALLVTLIVLLAGCRGSESASLPEAEATSEANGAGAGDAESNVGSAPGLPDPTPKRYLPGAQPGNAGEYAELIARLEDEVPTELRNDVPWPDLRNADPIVAQIEIFELWIWMAAHLPEPFLAEVMAAPGSPSREEIVAIFGQLDRDGHLERRVGKPYEAFDHQVITFESAGLPLWLGRDVPDDAVVVYYSDNSGPTEITDRDTGDVLEVGPATPTRAWLSIMVPTDVGWQLWRDQLIEPNDEELETPELAPPGADGTRPSPEV